MKIHEYQGKEILAKFGVPVPRGIPAYTVQEAVEAAQKLGGPVWVVKAQIHAGGRGKGGGVKVAKSIDEVRDYASEDPRHAARHAPDRPRARRSAASHRRGRRHPQGAVLGMVVTDRVTQKVHA
jgi:succinyl-CoA synthetase beta subunit